MYATCPAYLKLCDLSLKKSVAVQNVKLLIMRRSAVLLAACWDKTTKTPSSKTTTWKFNYNNNNNSSCRKCN
jgi:hypothetical protein